MARQLSSSKAIVPQSSNSLQPPTPEEERKLVLAEYLYKYAAIANREMTAELLSIFFEALSDVPLNRLKCGLRDYLVNGDRFPWPSEIREASEL